MKNKIKKILCIVAVAGVVGLSGIMAYLTDTENATNKFTVGKVDITLTEPNWNEDSAGNITSNATIAKDPTVTNIGNNDAYVYLKVTVPVAEVVVADEDGNLKNDGYSTATQLFTYDINSNWIEITSKKETSEDSITYVYYYNTELVPNNETTSLFDKVKFANVVEETIDTLEENIDIVAYAIQANNLPERTTIESAYDIYVNQNK